MCRLDFRKLPRFRHFFQVLMLFAVLASQPLCAQSTWKPTQSIEMIVAASPGGGLDRTSRVLQKVFNESGLSTSSMVVLNKPGGGGAIGWSYLSKFAGDGHYISIASPTLITNHILGRSPLAHLDFTSLAMLFSEYIVFVTRANSKFESGKELLQALKSDAGGVTFAVSPGLGGANHIAVGAMAKSLNIDPKRLKIVSFNSAADAMVAALGGHVDINVAAASNAAPVLAAGRVKVLGVCAPKRLTNVFSEIPTWSEQGVDVTVVNWRAAFGPSRMSPEQVRYWTQTLAKLTSSTEWVEQLQKNHWGATFMGADELAGYLKQEQDRLRGVLVDVGLAK